MPEFLKKGNENIRNLNLKPGMGKARRLQNLPLRIIGFTVYNQLTLTFNLFKTYKTTWLTRSKFVGSDPYSHICV